jgi:1-acyl-sn-glycerol-3-phosphate acyltransferase
MHPEGTRGKGPDPYQFLPAQPGVGKLALIAQPVVIPAFIHGLGNSALGDIRANFARDARTSRTIVLVFGSPVDYADLCAEKPRPTLYKKCADRLMSDIKALSEREKVIRAELLAGKITDDDPRWIENRPISRLYAAEAWHNGHG